MNFTGLIYSEAARQEYFSSLEFSLYVECRRVMTQQGHRDTRIDTLRDEFDIGLVAMDKSSNGIQVVSKLHLDFRRLDLMGYDHSAARMMIRDMAVKLERHHDHQKTKAGSWRPCSPPYRRGYWAKFIGGSMDGKREWFDERDGTERLMVSKPQDLSVFDSDEATVPIGDSSDWSEEYHLGMVAWGAIDPHSRSCRAWEEYVYRLAGWQG